MGEYLERLKELRIKKGVYQKDVAKAIGVSTQAYAMYENGSREPGIAALKRLCAYYDVTMDYLLGVESRKKTRTVVDLFAGTGSIDTLVAHFEGDEFTDNELDEIKQFAEFVKNKRSLKDQINEAQKKIEKNKKTTSKSHSDKKMER